MYDMRVMFDTGVFGAAQYAECAQQNQSFMFANKLQTIQIAGFIRKPAHRDARYQQEKDALCTVGRLLRTSVINGYTYPELDVELFRGLLGMPYGNAFRECRFLDCASPIERSKLFQTINADDFFAKGGRKDRKAGTKLGGCNHLAFLRFLSKLSLVT